jgi:hypothetical protein
MAGHQFQTRHRLRLAISPTYWPHAWPSPTPVTGKLFTGRASQLRLPVRPFDQEQMELRPFLSPECAQAPRSSRLRPLTAQRTKHTDIVTGKTELQLIEDYGRVRLPGHHLEYDHRKKELYTLIEGDPLSATVMCAHTIEMKREAWQVRIETESKMTANANFFFVNNVLDAYEGHTRIFNKTWTVKIARDLV